MCMAYKRHDAWYLFYHANPCSHRRVPVGASRSLFESVKSQPSILKGEQAHIHVHVQWTASIALGLHLNDGDLLVTHPQVLGDGIVGTIVEVHKRLNVIAVNVVSKHTYSQIHHSETGP